MKPRFNEVGLIPSSFVLWIACCGICLAQPAATGQIPKTEGSLKAIRAQADAFVEAFNKGDAKAVAALWTEDGEYVDDSGQHYVGRAEIEKAYADIFSNDGVGKIQVMVDSLRMLSPDAALEDGRAVIEPTPAGMPGGYSMYTVVHVKHDGKWQMASVRDTWVDSNTAHDKIADLQWLIGSWIAEEKGVKTESVCKWVANKSFVQRDYTTTDADGTQTSGVQIIGWNAAEGYVQSWDFSPAGGHSIGIWTPQPEGWSAQMTAVTGDGVMTTAVNLLSRLDDDAYVWKSVQRTYGDQTLPDTAEVVLRRKSVSQ